MFELIASGNGAVIHETHDTKAAAITAARAQGFEAFEVREIATDTQVYVEWPQARWV